MNLTQCGLSNVPKLLYCVLNSRNVYHLISNKYAAPLPTVKEEKKIEKT